MPHEYKPPQTQTAINHRHHLVIVVVQCITHVTWLQVQVQVQVVFLFLLVVFTTLTNSGSRNAGVSARSDLPITR